MNLRGSNFTIQISSELAHIETSIFAMTIKFSNPIGGRKRPLPLSSLFLFNPDVVLKISGFSMSGIMKESGLESIYKRIQSPNDEIRMSRAAHDMAQRIPDLPKNFVDAIHGDIEAREHLSKVGAWEAFVSGVYQGKDKWPGRLQFCIEIERATYLPLLLLHKHQFTEASTLLVENPLIQLLLWPEAIDILKNRSSLDALMPLRGLIALEMVLSLLAGLDAEVCHSLFRSDSLVLDVLPTTQTGNKNPTSLFFKWIKTQIGLPTISAILKTEKASELKLDDSLLKRWSNGSHMPSEQALTDFLESFLDDSTAKDIWMRHYGTKCLTFIGYQVRQMQAITNAATKTDALKQALRPWPDMPFGFKTIEAWFENRYPFWFEYHRKQIEGEGIKPSPTN